jgi:predicted transcriptional regulator
MMNRATVKVDPCTVELVRGLAQQEDRKQGTVLRRAVALYAALEPMQRHLALVALEAESEVEYGLELTIREVVK